MVIFNYLAIKSVKSRCFWENRWPRGAKSPAQEPILGDFGEVCNIDDAVAATGVMSTSGASPKVVQRLARHSTISLTMDNLCAH